VIISSDQNTSRSGPDAMRLSRKNHGLCDVSIRLDRVFVGFDLDRPQGRNFDGVEITRRSPLTGLPFRVAWRAGRCRTGGHHGGTIVLGHQLGMPGGVGQGMSVAMGSVE